MSTRWCSCGLLLVSALCLIKVFSLFFRILCSRIIYGALLVGVAGLPGDPNAIVGDPSASAAAAADGGSSLMSPQSGGTDRLEEGGAAAVAAAAAAGANGDEGATTSAPSVGSPHVNGVVVRSTSLLHIYFVSGPVM